MIGAFRAAAERYGESLSILQIDAHADLRDSFMGTPHNHACAMRRVLEHARTTQVGIRSLSPEEAADAPSLPTTIFYDHNMRRDPDWPGAKVLYQLASSQAYRSRESSASHSHPPPPARK